MSAVNDHLPRGGCCDTRQPGPGERLIRFENIYEDGEEITVRHCVPLLTPEQFAALSPEERNELVEDMEVTTYEEYITEELHQWTGVGRDGDAGYFAESIDGLEPAINEEWC